MPSFGSGFSRAPGGGSARFDRNSPSHSEAFLIDFAPRGDARLFLGLGAAVRLILHTPDSNGELRDIYRHAFTNAVELFIVTAFLTEWDTSLELSADCRRFRVITGKDFGITKKAACTSLMGWLPPTRKHEFMVADRISGFHPKAVFWKEKSGRTYAIVGSSNLTLAAFETNYEANSYGSLTTTEYARAKSWIKRNRKAGGCRVGGLAWQIQRDAVAA